MKVADRKRVLPLGISDCWVTNGPAPRPDQQRTTARVYNLRVSVGREGGQGSAGFLAAAAPQATTVKVLAWATGSLVPQLPLAAGGIHALLAGPSAQVPARGGSQELGVTHSRLPRGLLQRGRLPHSR